MGRICSVCGETNNECADVCVNCGSPLKCGKICFDAPILELYEYSKKKTITITKDAIIGREENGEIEKEFFSADIHISDPHCRFFFEDGTWKVEDLDSLNKTYINRSETELPAFFPVAIHDNSTIKIADLFFRVSLINRTNDDESHEDISAEEHKTAKWVIKCPVCGTLYTVENEDSEIKLCQNCDDDLDKKKIGFARPYKVE